MLLFLYSLLLAIASLVLIYASSKVVHSLEKLSHFFALREFSVAFILMALATSLPEVFVAISSALEKTPAIALGNALGSNILNLTLVAGIIILASKGIPARSVIVRHDALIMMAFAIAPLLLLSDKVLSRWDGTVLILFYLFYLFTLLRQRSAFKERHNHVTKTEALKSLLGFASGVAFLLGASDVLVRISREMALMLGVPLGLVGILFVALGTSLPEIAFELKASRKGNSGLALGDLVGSVVTNATLVLGITSVITPIKIPSLTIYLSSVLYLITTLISFEIFVRTDKKLVHWEGVFLIFIYVCFLLTEMSLEYLR